jgi:hypothetical protein
MSKIDMSKKLLLTDFFCDDAENLSSQTKSFFKKFVIVIFFKNFKIFSQWKLYGNFRKCFYAKIMPEILL